MSALLRILRATRTSNPLQTLRISRNSQSTSMSNYFSPSHSPFSGSNRIGLTRSRFYSNYGRSHVGENLNVLYGLIGVNLAVFSYAMYAKAQAQAGYPGPYIKFFSNMTCNLTDVLKNGAWYTLLTSTFTHVDFFHLAGNMLTAYYLGSMLCYMPIINPGRLLTIALGAGVTGSAGFVYQRYLASGGQGMDHVRGLGFSGALMGITSVAACLAPTAKVLIYGIVPVPLWATVAGYAFFDGYYLNDSQSRIGHAGHLGGLAFGILYYLLRLRGLRI